MVSINIPVDSVKKIHSQIAIEQAETANEVMRFLRSSHYAEMSTEERQGHVYKILDERKLDFQTFLTNVLSA